MSHLTAKMHSTRRHGFRKVAFDWRPSGGPCPICGTDHGKYGMEEHSAPLENGHVLKVNTYHSTPHLNIPADHGWGYEIHDPSKYPEEPSKYEQHDGEHLLGAGGGDYHEDQEDFPTRAHAQQAAEQHYQKLFPMGGGGSGGHDSGVDYSDLNSFRI